jgi:tRNA-Thr(GGU) m(6)t(6)A37 methyltransferase TsaA
VGGRLLSSTPGSSHPFKKISLSLLNLRGTPASGVKAMSDPNIYSLTPIAFIQSSLTSRSEAPRQGSEGAPDAWINMVPAVVRGLEGIVVGQDIILITWFHQARRNVLRLHPRGDKNLPLTGVFKTRSPDRPNPIGLHRVRVLEIAGDRLRVGPLEAIDGTPVVDIKPVLSNEADGL